MTINYKGEKLSKSDIINLIKNDFEFYAEHFLKIKPKDGPVCPFILNEPQRKLLKAIEGQDAATGRVRIIILKARQQGFSTFVGGYDYKATSQNKAKKALVIAHKSDSTRALFGMYRRIHENVPDFIRPSTQYASAKELHFDRLDSGIKVETASGKGVGRGETFNYVHISEMAFWEPNVAHVNWNSLSASAQAAKSIIIESTANGMSGVFYDLWQGAIKGENEYLPFFSPWFDSPEYRRPVPEHFERTFEEQDLVDKYGLDDEQLCFRRKEVAINGREQFEQEYPSNPEEAFKASGRPVFDPVEVHQQIASARPLLRQMVVDTETPTEHSRGELRVYIERDPKETYTIGADVAMGLKGGDYSVAQVLDSKRRQVAVWRGHIQPDAYALVLKRLGVYYNIALVAPEANNHGILTAVELSKTLQYPNVFKHVIEGQTEDRNTSNVGFRTTHVTKPLIIDRLRAELRQGSIEINDPETLKEMLTYVVTDSGGFEAQAKCFDDCVMALAFANHLLVAGAWKPVKFDSDCYFDPL